MQSAPSYPSALWTAPDDAVERDAPAVPALPRTLICVLWPGFLLACAVELLVFALVDPGHLRWAGEVLPLSRQAAYAAAFFVFWSLATVAGALTVLLQQPAAERDDAQLERKTQD